MVHQHRFEDVSGAVGPEERRSRGGCPLVELLDGQLRMMARDGYAEPDER